MLKVENNNGVIGASDRLRGGSSSIQTARKNEYVLETETEGRTTGDGQSPSTLIFVPVLSVLSLYLTIQECTILFKNALPLDHSCRHDDDIECETVAERQSRRGKCDHRES